METINNPGGALVPVAEWDKQVVTRHRAKPTPQLRRPGYLAGGSSSVSVSIVRSSSPGSSWPPASKVIGPLMRTLALALTTAPASRSKRIVPSPDSIFRSLLVTFRGEAELGSIPYLTSSVLTLILSSVLSPSFSVPAYSYFL